MFRADKTAWLVLPIKGLAFNLRKAAAAGDQALRAQQKKPNQLEECGRLLMQCFSAAHLAPGAPHPHSPFLHLHPPSLLIPVQTQILASVCVVLHACVLFVHACRTSVPALTHVACGWR